MYNTSDFYGSDEDEELVTGDDDEDEGWQDQEEDDMPPRRSLQISVSDSDSPTFVVPIISVLNLD